MNPDLQHLQPYPFEKLAQLKASCTPPEALTHITLSIGEPKHPTPEFILTALQSQLASDVSKYPATKGSPALRETISDWVTKRFKLAENSIDPEQHVLPVNGTREALFAFAQCVVDRQQTDALVLMPNPFYQIYEGATLLAGAQPYFINSHVETGYQPDFKAIPDNIWDKCQLLFICSPNNPTGTVLDIDTLKWLIEKADKHDFIIASDECYSELYANEDAPPVGLLQACAELGRNDYQRCVVFHSLSKRSNAPGLRSGFVAGDAAILKSFLLYRTYHGCAMSPAIQTASIAAWQDEEHVKENRRLYREKYAAVLAILSPVMEVTQPPASFYLFPKTPVSDLQFTRDVFNQQHVTVVPASFLSREAHGVNPGENRIRMALVAPLDECIEAAQRIRTVIESY